MAEGRTDGADDTDMLALKREGVPHTRQKSSKIDSKSSKIYFMNI